MNEEEITLVYKVQYYVSMGILILAKRMNRPGPFLVKAKDKLIDVQNDIDRHLETAKKPKQK